MAAPIVPVDVPSHLLLQVATSSSLVGKEGYCASVGADGRWALTADGATAHGFVQSVTSSTSATVRLASAPVRGVASAAINEGAELAATTNGDLVTATAGDEVVGIAIKAAAAASDPVLFIPYASQFTTAASAYTQTYSTANKTVANPTGTAVGTTLTDSTGLSGSHDDTIAAITNISTITDNTGGTPGSGTYANLADGTTYANDHAVIENNFATTAAELTKVRTALGVLTQNQSDLAQKIIELVTLANALVADDLDNRQSITAIIDDLQAAKIAG